MRALLLAVLLVACTAHHGPPLNDVAAGADAWHAGRITAAEFDARELHDLQAVAAWRDGDPTPTRQLWVEWTRLTLDEPDAPGASALAARARDLAERPLRRAPVGEGPTAAQLAGAIFADDAAAEGRMADQLDSQGVPVAALAARVGELAATAHLDELVASAQRLLLIATSVWGPQPTGLDPRILLGDAR